MNIIEKFIAIIIGATVLLGLTSGIVIMIDKTIESRRVEQAREDRITALERQVETLGWYQDKWKSDLRWSINEERCERLQLQQEVYEGFHADKYDIEVCGHDYEIYL